MNIQDHIDKEVMQPELHKSKNEGYEDDLKLQKVDIKALFNKYISLVEKVWGKERAKEIRNQILEGKDISLLTEEPSARQEEYKVLIDLRDGKVLLKENKDAMRLLECSYIKDAGKRLSDIFIFRGKTSDAPHRVRCKVDGVQQMSVELNSFQEQYWQGERLQEMKNLAKVKLAAECFSRLLCRQDRQCEQNMDMRR